MQQVTPILGDESAIQYQGVKDSSSRTGSYPVVGLMVGTFKRGRFDKPMTITGENIRSQLGYEPKNPSYVAVQDALSQGVPSVQVLRVKGGSSLLGIMSDIAAITVDGILQPIFTEDLIQEKVYLEQIRYGIRMGYSAFSVLNVYTVNHGNNKITYLFQNNTDSDLFFTLKRDNNEPIGLEISELNISLSSLKIINNIAEIKLSAHTNQITKVVEDRAKSSINLLFYNQLLLIINGQYYSISAPYMNEGELTEEMKLDAVTEYNIRLSQIGLHAKYLGSGNYTGRIGVVENDGFHIEISNISNQNIEVEVLANSLYAEDINLKYNYIENSNPSFLAVGNFNEVSSYYQDDHIIYDRAYFLLKGSN